jgi:DNA-directed RNA polymerase specialized sigma24 family protein
MHPSTSHAASDAAWRLLVHRARTGTPAWVIGAVGVAAPGLWNAVKRLGRPSDADHTDVQALVLEGFLQALLTVDPAKPGVCPYLCRRAHNLARARLRDAEPIARGEGYTSPKSTLPPQPWGHPDFVLTKAVRLGVISGEDADLIGVTRLENVSVVDYARRTGMNLETAWKRRRRAERRLVAALAEGRLSDSDCDVISEPTPTVASFPPTRA